MDFLKSAVASAISKGPPFPYTFGDRVDVDNSVWSLYNGTKREDGSNCSIFSFEINDSTRSRLPLAKNALRKLRTLRHPGVVKIIDSAETDSYIYIATERVTPLSWHVRREALNTETIKWGLHSTAITLKFINEEAASIHGNIRASSIYTAESGEWKLAGFEVLSSMKDDDPVIYKFGGLLPDSGRYASPEVVKGGWDALRNQPIHAADSWNFGTLVYEVFNAGAFTNSEQLAQAKKVPPNMVTSYKRLIQQNPKTRLSVAHFLEQGSRSRAFFDTPLIHVAQFVENMGVKNQDEREEFLRGLEETGDQFPEDFFKAKILPELLKSVEFGGGGPKVFSVVLKIGEKLSDEEWESNITPCIVRLFAVPDRATRVFLLDNLPKMIDHLSNRVVNDKIFPEMLTGFSDVAPIVREQTVKAVLVVVPKLSDRNVNGDLLKYLAKTQNDEQPGIRTNTTICLGKIARNLGPNTRQKVLTAAFTRALRDPFVHARNAALLALAATADVFDESDCAVRLLPAITPSLVDKEKLVRAQANKTLDVFLQRIKTLTANYPDTAIPSPTAADPGAAAAPRMGTVQTDESSWAGWAISNFTKKLSTASGEIERAASPSGLGNEPRSASAPITAAAVHPRPGLSIEARTASVSTLHRKALSPTTPAPPNFLGDEDNEDNDPDAWGDLDEETFFDAEDSSSSTAKPKPTTTTSSRSFDEWGEPDIAFMGNKSKNPLPKGLTKKPTTTSTTATAPRIGVGNAFSNGKGNIAAARKPLNKTTGMKPMVAGTKPAPAPVAKKAEAKKADAWDDDADGWGDGWDI
ncbi:ARM repeat-containing protein [Choiromyces venosus 120613-1]|uniref:ARM repeat-containing protein n=1 Tax=Choiromyces venosus 120613-1 TaxID=1336337 RepID=A0A3N4J221_9PEZI|nr:ARM repeat-containing protein [Choiromyces venosus 120613-1]